MSETNDKEAAIAKFPGIASISLSITPVGKETDFELIEAIVRVYDENDEQIMQQKARSLFTIAKNLKLFIQNRTDLPINDGDFDSEPIARAKPVEKGLFQIGLKEGKYFICTGPCREFSISKESPLIRLDWGHWWSGKDGSGWVEAEDCRKVRRFL